MMPVRKNPVLIGVAGGSCSGKTTLVTWLHTKLGAGRSVIMGQDNYYRNRADLSNELDDVNFDHPDALDWAKLRLDLNAIKVGKAIAMPHYDFATHARTRDVTMLEPAPIVLMDGILILSEEAGITDLFDLSIYVQCPEDLRYARRLERDTRERGRTEESVYKQFFTQVAPMHEQYVSPSQRHADLVYSQSQYMDLVLEDAHPVLDRIEALVAEKSRA